jgi:hypothetical protein
MRDAEISHAPQQSGSERFSPGTQVLRAIGSSTISAGSSEPGDGSQRGYTDDLFKES